MEYLNITDNHSSLSNLQNLRIILLQWNQITDIEPLILNQGINSGDVIVLTGNPLNDISVNNYIPDLIDRGVTVTY